MSKRVVTVRGIKYVEIAESEVPFGVRFDTPAQYRGQAIETQFGDWGRSEHCVGDTYMRTIDHSDGERHTYRRDVQDGGGQ